MNKKIIVGLIASDGAYKSAIDAARETCYHPENIPDNISVYFLYGHRAGIDIAKNEYKVIENNFYCDHTECKTNFILKTLEFYQWCLENVDFDYIYRGGANCYLDLDLFNKSIEEHNVPSSEAWYAHGIFAFAGVECVSGIGLLSRDMVEFVVKYKHRLMCAFFNYGKIDDIAMGAFLNIEQGFKPKLLHKMVQLRHDDINEDTVNDSDAYYWFYRTNDPRCFHKVHEIKKGKRS